jgi:hypothetical protein
MLGDAALAGLLGIDNQSIGCLSTFPSDTSPLLLGNLVRPLAFRRPTAWQDPARRCAAVTTTSHRHRPPRSGDRRPQEIAASFVAKRRAVGWERYEEAGDIPSELSMRGLFVVLNCQRPAIRRRSSLAPGAVARTGAPHVRRSPAVGNWWCQPPASFTRQ